MKDFIRICDVEKYYGTGTNVTKAVDRVSFHVEQGEFLGIMGASGSGKTTLLNILSTIDTVTSGHIFYENDDITLMNEDQLSDFRRDNLGFVFQDFNLLDTLTIRENIVLALSLQGKQGKKSEEKAREVMDILDIAAIQDKFPYQVSGGQKQRCACARALVTGPKLILADEPTGALDSKASDTLLRLFGQVNQAGQTVLMVTHSIKAASHAKRVLFLQDGEVYHQLYRGDQTSEQLYAKISDTLTVLTQGGELHA